MKDGVLHAAIWKKALQSMSFDWTLGLDDVMMLEL